MCGPWGKCSSRVLPSFYFSLKGGVFLGGMIAGAAWWFFRGGKVAMGCFYFIVIPRWDKLRVSCFSFDLSLWGGWAFSGRWVCNVCWVLGFFGPLGRYLF